jgi:excisionase family DNA binding protein
VEKQEGSSANKADLTKRRAFKIAEAANALGVKPVTIRRLIARGLIRECRVLRHILIPVEEIDRLLLK